MIAVRKDYNDIPEALKSDRVNRMIEISLKEKAFHKETLGNYRFILSKIRDRLYEIYHDKCAYCESKLSVSAPAEIIHYRPKLLYYWLIFEWSNLLPICERCNRYRRKGNKFPLENENKRVTQPQDDRQEWLANSKSFLAEQPLLLNPEIDDPEKSLCFYPDGRIHGLDKRGRTTIKVFNLNRAELVLQRKKVIDYFQDLFKERLLKLSEFKKEKDTVKLLDLAFEDPFDELFERTRPEAEYALLGRCMVKDFHSFFTKELPGEEPRKLLCQAFEHFRSSRKESLAIKAIESSPPSLSTALEKISVETLKIENVKCFEKVKLQLQGNSTLVLGSNGRGKSTILQLLALGLSGMDRPPGSNDWLQVTKAGQDNAAFEIRLNTSKGAFDLGFSIDENDRIKCVKNAKKYDAIKDNVLVLAYGHGRNVSSLESPPYEKYEGIASLFGNREYLKRVTNSDVYEKVKSGFTGIKALINKILELAETRYSIGLVDFSPKEGFYFKTPTDPSGHIPLEAVSDGFKSMFVLLFDLIIRAWEKGVDIMNSQGTTGIVMIDEIDLHLHPTWQRTILPALQEGFPNIQFIVTSHSPFVVQSMETDNIILLRVKKESVTAKKLKLEGKPYGHEIKSIIKQAIGVESEIPGISATLFEWIKEFEKAVEKGDKQSVTRLHRQIKEAIPRDSRFSEYLEIMSAGLLLKDGA